MEPSFLPGFQGNYEKSVDKYFISVTSELSSYFIVHAICLSIQSRSAMIKPQMGLIITLIIFEAKKIVISMWNYKTINL